MKKKDLINFEGKWKGKEKDANGFGGREMQFLELAERLILFLLLLWLFLIPFENRARAADSSVVESVSIDFRRCGRDYSSGNQRFGELCGNPFHPV